MNLTKKLFGVIAITLSLVSVYPEKAYALDGGAGFTLVAKEYGLDGLAWYAGNRIIRKISAQTVNWINSGFKGSPAYVKDPEQFFLNVGDNVASYYLSSAGPLNQLCSPFKPQVRLALVKNYLYDSENYSCTLGTLERNYDAFTNDFSQGGWDSWFIITQNNNNNPYGAYLSAQTGLSKRIDDQIKKYTDQLNQGGGFLSFEKCKEGTELTQSDADIWNATYGEGSFEEMGNTLGDCAPGNKETVTPGSVIEEQLNQTLSSGLKRLEAADEIDEIIGALLNQLINKAIGSVGGLFGASEPDSNGRTFTDDLANDSSDKPPARNETNCTTSPDGIDENGNIVPGITTCIANQPPPPDEEVVCTTDSSGVMHCTTGNKDDGSGTVCQAVTEQGALNILRKYSPTDTGIQQALPELRSTYGSQVIVFGNPGDFLDKINFGGGMVVDVISNAGSSIAAWTWILNSSCGGSGGSGNGGGGGGGGGVLPASLILDIQTERAKYGVTMTPDEIGRLLNTVAWNNRSIGWGLSRKNFGTFCPSPAGSIACDILIHQPTNTWVDVFLGDGRETPQWNVIAPNTDPNRAWITSVQP